jgi:formylglycine-generating enzyme required for sulfatase activity
MKRSFALIQIFAVSILACVACGPVVAPTSATDSHPKCTAIGQTWVSPVDGVTLVCVPAGRFRMGASEDDPLAKDSEKPQHEVNLDPYWIDRSEVTNLNFGKCLAAGACHPKQYETSAENYVPYSVHPDSRDYPALLYESDPAVEYCQWAGRRLPTEAEWEKAARGTDARLYPWGNDPLDCNLANYYACGVLTVATSTTPRCGNSEHCQTKEVNSYPAGASPYGALNMAGNVWEWVADWYQADYYSQSLADNPKGPANGDFRVIRGGGATSISQDLRVTRRASGEPEHYMDGQMGFRCAMDSANP